MSDDGKPTRKPPTGIKPTHQVSGPPPTYKPGKRQELPAAPSPSTTGGNNGVSKDIQHGRQKQQSKPQWTKVKGLNVGESAALQVHVIRFQGQVFMVPATILEWIEAIAESPATPVVNG